MRRIKKQIKHVTAKPKANKKPDKIVATKSIDKKPEALIRSFRIDGEAAELANLLGVDLNLEVRQAVNEAVGLSGRVDKNRISYFIVKLQKLLEG